MRYPELDAFEEEAAAVEATLRGVPDDAWERPALGEWTVAELVAHLVRGVTRVDAYLDVDVEGDTAAVDRVGYWRFDLAAEAPAVARRARDEAAGLAPDTMVERFAEGWRTSAGRAGGLPPDHLLTTLRGPMRLDEYLATRVVELVVHHMDLCAAVDQPPSPTASAGAIAASALESLLGSPRPRNMGRDRFLRAATGRIPVDDPRFPVLR